MKRLLALILVLALALSAVACQKPETGDPTESTPAPTAPREGVYSRDSYSVSDAEAKAAAKLAVATMGDATLTNGVLQIYYWMQVYTFLQQYGAYAQYYMSLTTPLDQQYVQSGLTFQQSFLSAAIAEWETYQSLALMAEKENIPLAGTLQEDLDNLYETLSKSAEENKFESVDAMLAAEMGAGCDYESYYEYTRVYFLSYSYYNHVAQQCNFSQEDIDKYFAEHAADLKTSGITKDVEPMFGVRHILIEVASTKTEADWEACRVEAQGLLDQWLADNPTEDSFAALANAHSDDPGSKALGGLYDGLDRGTSFVQPFKDWYLADGRQVGDYGLIKTDYGYHLMYLSSIQDTSNVHSVRHILITPEGGTTDANGYTTYSEEEWNACMVKAQGLLNQWLEGDSNEEAFIQMAKEHSTDTGSNSNGGLYQGLDEDTSFVTSFKNWYLKEGRQTGDYGLVKSEYGYHIMYYVKPEVKWVYLTNQTMITETCNQAMADARETYPSEVDYSKIVLGVVSLVEESQ